ncbi:proto-oncogene tyrosine-protein kinase ROS-like [Ctenocephalides felis]|uniref:proto-oncogene tyrosine-protein kinase ROS-like n=1 Tax=Ctenocephalides felis TaxID=7515 RepID=UPI000E6E12CA|nr:proto-oncogene tyrosine-protein kinase ROS-like [Ctenocephalides felis]
MDESTVGLRSTKIRHKEKIQGCTKGCRLLEEALESSCSIACNGTDDQVSVEAMHCALGCNEALSKYFIRLKKFIGTPAAPALVANSLTATSLALEWNGTPLSVTHGGRLLAQWRYEEQSAAWHFFPRGHPAELPPLRADRVVAVRGDQHFAGRTAAKSSLTGNCIGHWPEPCSRLLGDWPVHKRPDTLLCVADKDSKLRERTRIFIHKDDVIDEQLLFIFSSERKIFRLTLVNFKDYSVLYESNNASITGSAVHISKSLLFISDSNGYIHRKLIRNSLYENEEKSEVIISPFGAQFKPFDLTIDWLNDHLYILGQVKHEGIDVWQIVRSNLNGQFLIVAVGGISLKPRQIDVDPYNGYIFWINAEGLFRLDLANINNGVKHDKNPELILKRDDLYSFTLDCKKFRLLVPIHGESAVISILLDGSAKENKRTNIRNSKFQNVTSLVYINERFFWINGYEIYLEDYHEEQNMYFHNSIPFPNTVFKIYAYISSAQPTPVPVNPPISAQALLGIDVAQISWRPPQSLATQGKGAWQKWTYEILIMDEKRNMSHVEKSISSTDVTVHNLRPDTEYRVKVAAYTISGRGPWSGEFISKTLPRPFANQEINLLWSTREGVMRSDVTGSNLNTIISSSQLFGSHVTDIDWFEDVLYLVLNSSRVYMYHTTEKKLTRYSDLESVGSIAVDWLGRKLYWASPNQQLIFRGSLSGNHRESLPMLALARELKVDSVEVIGLTLTQSVRRVVMWIIRSDEGSMLYTAPMNPTAPFFRPLQGSQLHGPLCQFGERLMWLRDDSSVAMSDITGNYTAIVSSPGLVGLRTVIAKETSARILRNGTASTNDPIFIYEVRLTVNETEVRAYGIGTSKQRAKHESARSALERLSEMNSPPSQFTSFPVSIDNKASPVVS